MSARTFFRAVNLASDIDNPERLAHYQPTTRSLPVVEAVLGREPTLIVASYGSGKSLAAGVGALIAMNDAKSRPVAERVLQRVKPVDAAAHQRLKARFAARGAGIAVALTGHVEDLPGQLAEWLGAPPKLGSLERVLHWASSNLGRAQHIAIVWDEFGRHLEGLVAEGRSRDLDAVQRIAEWAARAEKPTVSLTLLTHQNLLAYAGGLNQTSRNEWRKVEGRFRTLRFVEDSREIYRVLLDFIGEKRSAPARRFDPAAKDLLLRAAKDSGWIDGAVEAFGGAALVDRAWPVSLGVLHALPRVAARVGQNERSQYAFLETADLSAPVGFEELYRFFSEEMRSDVGPGGSHRRWIETESARAKARNDAEREALAAACLLQLGADGERRRLSRAALEAAVASRGLPAKEAVAAVQSLIDRKLLLHRRAVDDVSVWHGVDVDVGGRLAEERAKVADSFDVVAFLGERRPPPIVRATRHNVEVGAVRYLAGRYVLPQALGRPANGDAAVAETRGPWGDVFYVLAESVSEIADAKAAAAASTRDRTIHVVPNRPLKIVDAALEVACLETLRADGKLLGEDPLVAVEIDELLAVARRQLDLAVHRLTSDRPTEATWLLGGEAQRVSGELPASVVASDLMGIWYPKTPRIANDQLMRQRISKQMNTARVRLLMRLSESATKPWMGYGPEDTSVEASIYRTVLANTGLHHDLENGEWGFARPEDIRDPKLKPTWTKLRDFFEKPSPTPKRLSDLVGELAGPPIGLPAGVLPVLVMAGYRAFARCVALLTDGSYVPDILGFDANKMFAEPERHAVEVHDSDDVTMLYLGELAEVFAHAKNDAGAEALRFAHDAFMRWRADLPDGARRSRRLSRDARALLDAATEAMDPAKLFLRTLPELFGAGGRGRDAVVKRIEAARGEIDGLAEGYLDEAVRALGQAFQLGKGDPVDGVRSWVGCLDVDALMAREDLRLTDKAVLRTARDTANGRYTPASLAKAVSSVLLQRGVEQWQDGTVGQFAMLLRECRGRIEDAALATGAPSPKLAPVIKERIAGLQAMLERIESNGEARLAAAGGKR